MIELVQNFRQENCDAAGQQHLQTRAKDFQAASAMALNEKFSMIHSNYQVWRQNYIYHKPTNGSSSSTSLKSSLSYFHFRLQARLWPETIACPQQKRKFGNVIAPAFSFRASTVSLYTNHNPSYIYLKELPIHVQPTTLRVSDLPSKAAAFRHLLRSAQKLHL